MLENFQKRARQYASLFFVGHFIITVGSLFVPALLSIQNSSYATTHSEFGSQVYWITFALSLLVTMCNGMITLFKVDKKYYFLNTTMERLRSEGWQYVGLTGRYSGHASTHQNQFLTFTHHIEKIKMKQVEEEYYKMQEKSETNPPGAASTTIDLYPLSPDKPLSMMKQAVPGPVQDTVQSLLQAQEVDLRVLTRANTQALLLSDASATLSPLSSTTPASSASTASTASTASASTAPTTSLSPMISHTSVTFLGDQGIGNDVIDCV